MRLWYKAGWSRDKKDCMRRKEHRSALDSAVFRAYVAAGHSNRTMEDIMHGVGSVG